MSEYQYPRPRDCWECPCGAEETQDEVRDYVSDALASCCAAIRVSERREDYPCLLTALLALKIAEERVGR